MNKQIIIEMETTTYQAFEKICAEKNFDPIDAFYAFLATTLDKKELPLADKMHQINEILDFDSQ